MSVWRNPEIETARVEWRRCAKRTRAITMSGLTIVIAGWTVGNLVDAPAVSVVVFVSWLGTVAGTLWGQHRAEVAYALLDGLCRAEMWEDRQRLGVARVVLVPQSKGEPN